MGLHVLDVCLAILSLYLVGRLIWKRSASLPPGPPGWPLIGNVLDLPSHTPYKAMGAMSSKYGKCSIISLNLMGVQYVALNSFKATNDLLTKNSAITSNRPRFTMASDLVGWGRSTGLLQYGDTFRKHRKLFHGQIGTKNNLVKTLYPAQEAGAKQFVCNVSKNPDDLLVHARRMTSSVILKVSHGYSVTSDDDPFVGMANKAMFIITETATPGRFLVDSIPVLRHFPEWFPGCGFLKDAKRWRQISSDAVNKPYEFVLEHLAKGDAEPSFTSRLLQEGVTVEDEEILKQAAFSMYLGGSDTTPTTLTAFFLAMTLFPKVLKKAQGEVDTVVGRQRLPTMDDREVLPYVNAICKELLRWHVVFPLVMHVTTEEIIYDGYVIPKGTGFIGNIWFILSNPETYPDPDVFDPERFLGDHQQPDPREASFGWGRRICPGAQLAESTIFISVAMALATLDISKCTENGVEVVPKYDVEGGMMRLLKPFKCKIELRSKNVEDLLRG